MNGKKEMNFAESFLDGFTFDLSIVDSLAVTPLVEADWRAGFEAGTIF